MSFGVLGAVEVRRRDGSPVALGGPRQRSLLALLLLNAGRPLTGERMIDALYGDDPPADAANALQSQVSRLRRTLRESAANGLVESQPAGYRLAIDPDDVDAHRFERLARTGRRALETGDHAVASRRLREALSLWRGLALVDVRDAPFAKAQAARLEELRATAVEDQAEAELALGRHRALVHDLQDLVAAHPLRERARGLLMRALYGTGRQAEALAVFEDARSVLAEDLGTDPSAELTAVHLAVLRAEPEPAPAAHATPPDTPPRPAARAPAQLTSFVGREGELREIRKLFADGRLVTLTGPGGAGKTRLAIEASAREDGEVCFVDLAPVGAGIEVSKTLLHALGIRESGLLPASQEQQPDIADRLALALTDRRMLLVLDNCEHVVEDAARLTHRLLGACPRLRVLATSREPLGITGESLRPVPPLPAAPHGTAPREALGYPAVRLFADRAAAVRPGFELDEATTEHVLGICAALDGLPLAIELAAARLRTLTAAEVAARLGDRFRLLSRGSRTAAPRHRTLHAVVEWSWDLLEPAERLLARRLTVFAGGITLQAAARVCGLPEADTDELLADLAEKSLIESGGGRYRMLDTIRAFCAERLAEAGEEGRLRRAHATYFLDLARTADPHLLGADQLEWMDRLAAEHGNLQAALRWAVGEDPHLGLRLLAALSWYWWLRGLYSENGPLSAELLEAIGADPPADLDEEYALCVANATLSAAPTGGPGGPSDPHGPDGGPEGHLDRARSVLATIDRPLRHPATTLIWAVIGGPYRTDLNVHMKQIGTDPWSRALTHMSLGLLAEFNGDLGAAEPELGKALAGFRAVGERWGMANTLDQLSVLASWRGDRARSLALLDEALELVGELGALEDTADLLCRRGLELMHDGDLAAAQSDYEHAADFARRAGVREKLAAAHCGLGGVALARGDHAAARRLYDMAHEECTTGLFRGEMVLVGVHMGRGWLAQAEGDVAEARSQHRRALATALGHVNLPAAADAADGLAGAALLSGDGERAALLLGAGVALRGTAVRGDPGIIRITDRARALIGRRAYDAAHRRGTAMTCEEALAELGR